MARTATRVALAVGCGLGLLFAAPGAGAAQLESASGHGSLNDGKRQFSFNAKRQADGSVIGQAQLVNKAFAGEEGNPSPYRLHMDISCMKTVGNIAIFGGTTKSTNDPNLVDAAYFTVQDNAEPGRNADKISRVFFFDDNPQTEGDPALCEVTGPDDFPLETIETGNIQVRPGTAN